MRTLTTLLLSALLCSTAFAQHIRIGYMQFWQAGTWADSVRLTYDFISHGGLPNSLIKDIRENEAWVPQQRTSFTNQGDTLLLGVVYEQWDAGNQQWVNDEMISNSYNSSSQITGSTTSTWDVDNQQWVNAEMTSNSYNSSGQTTESTTSTWDGNDWQPSERVSHTYDANGFLIEDLSQEWNGGWQDVDRVTYTNDADGNHVVILSETMNATWETTSIDSITYDSEDREVLRVNWISFFGTIMENSKAETTYASDGTTTVESWSKLVSPVWIPLTFVTTHPVGDGLEDLLVQINVADPPDPASWENNFRIIYELDPLGIGEHTATFKTHLFPNPTTGPFTITSDATGPVDVTLYASTGQQMGTPRHFGTSESITVDPGDLAPGAYIVELTVGQRTARMPLLIQR